MSAFTRVASASASACDNVSTRFLSTSTLARSNAAFVSMSLTWAFCCSWIITVDVSSLSLTMRCSWFSSARFFLPFSITMVCSFLRFSSSKSKADFRWISPIKYSCSRVILSMDFRISVVCSRLASNWGGRITEVMVQLENATPELSNFLFNIASNSSARFPRSVRTVWCDCPRTSTRMPSSTAPESSWSKFTAPILYTKSSGFRMLKTMRTSTPTRTLSEVGHSFTGAL
mmetsp:Transcript_20648/g.65051  ORF Transcript_20648/g.65051 Transcript_20648/m.65051 type:complete len:230 (+) Transcript_20648:530-1219(+)